MTLRCPVSDTARLPSSLRENTRSGGFGNKGALTKKSGMGGTAGTPNSDDRVCLLSITSPGSTIIDAVFRLDRRMLLLRVKLLKLLKRPRLAFFRLA